MSEDDGEGTTMATGPEATDSDTGALDVDSSGSTSEAEATADSDTTGDADSTGPGETDDASSESGSESTGVEVCSVVLAEVVFDPTGGDDELQWVKLKNLCSYDVDLSEWTIGYGDVDYWDGGRQKRITGIGETEQFNTIIEGYGCYIVGGPMTAASNGDPIFDWPDDFAPGLENTIAVGVGVALFDLPAVDGDSIPVDAVVYGPNNDNGLIDETGNPVAVPHVGLPPEGGSITRTSAGPTWDMNVVPQAANCPAL